MKTKKLKVKKRYLVLMTVIGVLLIASVIFFQFTSSGYRMTIQYRNFTEMQKL